MIEREREEGSKRIEDVVGFVEEREGVGRVNFEASRRTIRREKMMKVELKEKELILICVWERGRRRRRRR